ncbi:class I SAM-dependent methyltransferase [archaeon]|jgi:ubiquinone/menaquinone biosynthesis C-methylase UbiE|nr:class I SAM-dependent methyltransferase [archaeon]MBT4021942.1 class I SAM-dependent methyltransferase [archaeon]MBT4272259.1 class I SAM-dependent methyltransferase [archaeon]MBT4460795.1 class I SAM-dependent methyltransferase [archaeon]MBT4858363.1 class I SAM-dependent methyltransferase [archaeon]
MDSADFWKEYPKEPIKTKPNQLAKRVYELTKNFQSKKILDIGVGRSFDPIFFNKEGYDVTVIDISPNRIKTINEELKLQSILNVKVILEDVRKINFPNQSFDIIYAHASLHYFNEIETLEVINNLFKILRPNGMIFIQCKSTSDSLFGKGNKLSSNIFESNGRIRHFFTKEFMKKLLNKFKVLELEEIVSEYIGHKGRSAYIAVIAKKL